MNLHEKIKEVEPKSIKINLSKEVFLEIEKWEKENKFYAIFPIKGDSMTCEDSTKSIPDGCNVLAVENDLSNLLDYQIPTNKPLLIKITDSSGNNQFVCKTISFVDYTSNKCRLTSYNKKHKDVWIPLKWINNILEVHSIVK